VKPREVVGLLLTTVSLAAMFIEGSICIDPSTPRFSPVWVLGAVLVQWIGGLLVSD
jgi:hypothetical protein